jgi:crossover junction endodeoxyribonuclease RuvC
MGTIVLGLDPGTEKLGFCLLSVESGPAPFRCVDMGVIEETGNHRDVRLPGMSRTLGLLIAEHRPTLMAMENGFVGKGREASLALGEARGVIIAHAAAHRVHLMRVSVQEAKRAVTGKGSASKTQVQGMVRSLLQLSYWPRLDASDAASVAIFAANRVTSLAGVPL